MLSTSRPIGDKLLLKDGEKVIAEIIFLKRKRIGIVTELDIEIVKKDDHHELEIETD